MTPADVSGDPSLVKMCLDFCQALDKNGQAYTITINLGFFLNFSVNTMPVMTQKKKQSPSRLRRNQKRKEEFLKRKSETLAETFKCDQCENTLNSENGLKIHKGKVYKKVEVLRYQETEVSSLEMSPLKEVQRDKQNTSPPFHPLPLTTPSCPSTPSTPSRPSPPSTPSPPWCPPPFAFTCSGQCYLHCCQSIDDCVDQEGKPVNIKCGPVGLWVGGTYKCKKCRK